MKVLITGATGFIGVNLIKSLAAIKKYELFGVGRSSLDAPNYSHLQLDISKEGWTEKINENMDVIIHLAQSKHYRNFPKGNKDLININIKATLELLEWACTHKVTKLIQASSGNIYGFSEGKRKEIDTPR